MGFKGAIRGIGTALTYAGQQGMAEQQEARRTEILYQRQVALEALQQRNREATADANLVRQKDFKSYSTNDDVRGETLRLGAAEPFHIRAESRAETRDKNKDERQAQIAVRLESLRSDLASKRDAASQRLQHDLESGDVLDVEVGGDGFYYTRTKKGLSKTDVQAPERPLTEAELSAETDNNAALTSYRTKMEKWESGGRKGPQPQRPTLTPVRSRSSATSSAPNTNRAEAWRTHIPVAQQLLGPKATREQVQAKARELASKYSGG